jgi:hypothetical protein
MTWFKGEVRQFIAAFAFVVRREDKSGDELPHPKTLL